MRESLTVLAMALIVVLTTALVGPYFVDWNAHRGAIETRLSALLGAKVTVGGPIDVKLLPRPIFRLGDVAVAGAAPRAATASAARLDVELALAGLLRGEFVFVDAELTAPRLTLVMEPDGSFVLPRFAATDPDHVSLSHVALHEGSVLVVDENGRPVLTAGGLSGDGEAESLMGPFRFNGQVDGPRGALGFRFTTGALDGGKLRLKGTLDAAAGLPRTELEGVVTLAEAAGGATRPQFEGSVASGDALPLAGGAALPWRVTGKVRAEAGAVEMSAVELRAGAEGRALVMNGDARVDLGAAPKGRLTLRARQADLSRLAVVPGREAAGADTASPGAATILAGLRSLAGNAQVFAGLPFPVSVDLGLEAVTLGHLTLGGFSTRFVADPAAPVTGALSIAAPDGSRLAFDGSLETGPAAVFKGRLDASTRDLGRLADALAPDLPDEAAALRAAIPAKALTVRGAVDLSAVGFAAHDADLTLDTSRFAGTITLTRAVGTDRARLFADLTSDALDLDALPDWRGAARGAADLDLSISLAARAVRLAGSDTGGVQTGHMTLQLGKVGAAVTLDRLLLADLGGATMDLSGRSDGRTAHIEGRLDAQRLRDLLLLAQRLAPSAAGEQLLGRAETLSPALLKLSADATLDADAVPSLGRAAIEGTVAGSSLAFRLDPDAERPGQFDTTLTLDAAEAGALLRQIGLATPPATAIGRSRLAADARLDADFQPVDGGLTATLGETVLTLRGTGRDAATLAGRATLKGPNVAPLLRAVSLANPDAAATWPIEAAADLALRDGTLTMRKLAGSVLGTPVKGDLAYRLPRRETAATAGTGGDAPIPPALTGTLSIDRLPLPALAGLALGPLAAPKPGAVWPETPFAPSLATLPRSDIALTVAAMPLTPAFTAREAKLSLKLAPGTVDLAGLSARLGEGRIEGTVQLRRNGPAASLSGQLGWSDLSSASPAFGGRTRGTLDLAGTGTSLATLVASLAGSGTVGVDEARLPRLDVAALARAVSETGETGANVLDDQTIREAITADLDRGALGLGSLSTAATVAAGVLRGEPVGVTTPSARATVVASLDLRGLLLSLTATVALPVRPRDWVGSAPQVTVSLRGPFAAPAREVDATALANGLAARAIARDQARIEAFQDDVRERAFFARRLRAIEAEQRAARDKAKAETEAQLQKLLGAVPGMPTPNQLNPVPATRPPARGGTPLRLDPAPRTP